MRDTNVQDFISSLCFYTTVVSTLEVSFVFFFIIMKRVCARASVSVSVLARVYMCVCVCVCVCLSVCL